MGLFYYLTPVYYRYVPKSYNFVGMPGFEPGVARSQSENVSRYTTSRLFCFQHWYLTIFSLII